MTEPAFKAMSVEEYLRTEPDSPVKREYVNGFVYPLHGQAGTSEEHDLIALNILTLLNPLAKRAGCYAHTSEMQVMTVDCFTYYYPDAMVTCEPRQRGTRFKVAPCLLVEVLSKSTAHNDHNAKYHAYTALPSLQTYLIAEQHERRVYVYQRGAEVWRMTEYVGEASIDLPCLNAQVSLNEIYDGVFET